MSDLCNSVCFFMRLAAFCRFRFPSPYVAGSPWIPGWIYEIWTSRLFLLHLLVSSDKHWVINPFWARTRSWLSSVDNTHLALIGADSKRFMSSMQSGKSDWPLIRPNSTVRGYLPVQRKGAFQNPAPTALDAASGRSMLAESDIFRDFAGLYRDAPRYA